MLALCSKMTILLSRCRMSSETPCSCSPASRNPVFLWILASIEVFKFIFCPSRFAVDTFPALLFAWRKVSLFPLFLQAWLCSWIPTCDNDPRSSVFNHFLFSSEMMRSLTFSSQVLGYRANWQPWKNFQDWTCFWKVFCSPGEPWFRSNVDSFLNFYAN